MTARATPEEKSIGALITDTVYNGQIIQNLLYALGFILVGDVKPAIRNADYGLTWLICDNRTIGSAASGASLADNRLETIFKHLWDTIDSSRLTIFTSAGGVSTKGLTADADWVANKRLLLPDMRGCTIIGIDGTRSVVPDAAADLMGGIGGLAKVTLQPNEAPSGGLRFTGFGGAYTISAGTTVTASTGQQHENMPPYFACNWMIFTGITYEP